MKPSVSLGRSGKVFLGATMLFLFIEAHPPAASTFVGTLTACVENTVCWAVSEMFHTIWNACA
jgi:hypothetical protein